MKMNIDEGEGVDKGAKSINRFTVKLNCREKKSAFRKS